MKILIRMPNWIGDLVMATPVLEDVRTKFPLAEITVISRSPAAELLKTDPTINKLLSVDYKNTCIPRTECYDLGILLTRSISSSYIFWKARVKERLGYGGRLSSLFINRKVLLPQEKMHQVEWYKKLLEPLGILKSKTFPRLHLSLQEIQDAKAFLLKRGYKEGVPLFGVNPGAAYGTAKCWPPERFRLLATKLLEKRPNATIVFLGNKEIVHDLPYQVLDLSGQTTIRELAAIMHHLTVLITNDSGPMHMAAAFGVPLVALFGSTDEELTGPYNQKRSVLSKHVSCSPCFKRKCPFDFRCMKAIEVEEVVEAAIEKCYV